ncbi:hypothetical protein H5410_062477 [Solanum commersonii]|uniref:Uncharacterized protein n=1 Tax=Solanum commersonii TaxID=4109 RepID=A0A9J5WBM2_SOLCO|nr:hypothetical protein H5410_062477 [Solanum commersonii]
MRQVTISINVMKWLVFVSNAANRRKEENNKEMVHEGPLFRVLLVLLNIMKVRVFLTRVGEILPKNLLTLSMIQTEKNPIPGRNRQTETSYKEAFDNRRWMTEETKTAHITARNNKISVIGGSAMPESDLLSRCVVGKFQFHRTCYDGRMNLEEVKAEPSMVESYCRMLTRGDQQGLDMGQIAWFTFESLVIEDI